MEKKKIKYLLGTPTLLLAIICFVIAGVSFWITQVKTTQNAGKPNIIIQEAAVSSYPTKIIAEVTLKIIHPVPTLIVSTNTPVPFITNTPTSKPTNTPVPSPKINLTVNEPDGSSNYPADYKSGVNPCSFLNDAKAAGKIKSVTIMHYDAPLNSDYVKEINGYSDNWTFSINGTKEPKGCSYYSLNSGDSVTWKYN
jgi:hypothetical protein